MQIKTLKYFWMVVATILALNLSALAQSSSTTGSIMGSVRDSQGAALTDAKIAVQLEGTNNVRLIGTQEDGSYTILQLPPGIYEVEVQADGFSRQKVKIELSIGTNSLINFDLSPSTTNDIIIIEANSELSVKSESSTNIKKDQINNLPINLRNFLGFTLTSPRAVKDRISAESTLSTSGISFNGQSARLNNITIDGLDNNEAGSGSVRSTFGQEAIQEFQVVSDNYSAEFGRALGGVINIVTKSGTNQFHSTLFSFFRSDETSARDVFTPDKTEYKQNQFGLTLSGPIKQDRAYFFTSFDRRLIRQNNLVTVADATVAAASREGFIFRNGPVPFSVGVTSFLARTDLQVNQNDTLWIRYNGGFSYDGAFEPFGSLKTDTNGGIQRLRDNTVAFNNTYINANLNLVNESRFLYNNFDQNVDPISNQTQISLFVPEGNVFFGTNRVLPQPRTIKAYQIVNNVSLVRGRHQIKTGVDFNLKDTTAKIPIFQTGFAVFQPVDFGALFGIPGLPTFTALQAFDPSLRSPEQKAFLQVLSTALPGQIAGFPKNLPLSTTGIPLAFIQGFGNTDTSVRVKLFSTFVQDDIKLKDNLLLKVGLRYDLARYEVFPTTNGNFSPRLSLIFRPRNSERLSLKASYGIFFANQLAGPTLAVKAFASGGLKILVQPFPFSLVPYSLPNRRFPIQTSLPSGANFVPQLSQNLIVQPDLKDGYSHQLTTGFDYFINRNTAVSVSYNLVRGVKLFSVRSINPIVRPIPGDPLNSPITGRVDPTQGEVFEFESAFDSYFHGVTFSIERRFTQRFGFLAHYTLSKTIDNFVDFRADFQETNDPLKPGNERSLSLQDVRNRLVVSGVWTLSYSKNPLLKDYVLSTIINLESGRPYNLLAGIDLNMNGDNPPGDRPLGLGRNAGITKGFSTVDVRLQRNFKFKETMNLQLIAEAFNIFNRVNFNTNSDSTNRIFLPNAQGQFVLPNKEGSRFTLPNERYQGAFSPRQFQIGVKVVF
jgi:hypothetical protein